MKAEMSKSGPVQAHLKVVPFPTAQCQKVAQCKHISRSCPSPQLNVKKWPSASTSQGRALPHSSMSKSGPVQAHLKVVPFPTAQCQKVAQCKHISRSCPSPQLNSVIKPVYG